MALLDELRAFWRAQPRDHRAAFIVIAIVAVVVRLMTLSQPMRYDESVTYMEFVRQPLAQALSRYDYPNNHLFHTLLAKASVAIFGNAPWALRLPSFLAGVFVVPLSYAVARALYNARAALVAAAIVAASGILALYSTNARGYSIIVALFLMLVLVASRLLRAPRSGLWVMYAVLSALGVWTIPVMLYPLGAVSLWLALSLLIDSRRKELASLAATLTAGALLTLLAYGPVFSHAGIAAVVRNSLPASSEWTTFLGDLTITGWDTLRSWGLGLPPIVSAAAFTAAFAAVSQHERLSSFLVGLPLAAFVWNAWLLVVTHRAPFPRIWLWCVPIVAALAGAGGVVLLDRYKRTAWFAARIPLVASIVAVGAAASVMISGAVLRTHDTGTFVDAEATAAQLAPMLRPGDRVLAIVPTNGPLSYYFDRLGLDPGYLRLNEADADRIIVVVNEGEGESVRDVLEGEPGLDPQRFGATLIADRPLSKVYLFERKNAPK